MKITKTQLKQIVQETLTEVRLDTKGTTAGKVQMAGNILTGAAFIIGAPFGGVGAPVAGGIAAAINSMANKFWTSRKMKSVEVTERHLVIAADKILSAAIDKGLDEQEIVKAISDDIRARLENVPVNTVKMLRFEEYEVDKAPGSAGAKAAVKNALEELGLFGKDTAAHKVKRVTDFVTSPVKSIKNLGDPSKYLSESGKKISKSQLKQIVKEELSKTYA
mgnify:CR=1 FL=1